MKKSKTTTYESPWDNIKSTRPVRLRETDICIGEMVSRHVGKGGGSHSAQLDIVDGWVEDITDTKKEVFIIITFDFAGSRRRKSFYFRDVFSRRITLASVDGTFPSKGDYQFEVTASMFPEILVMVNRQLEDNFLSEHKVSFERQLCMALWPLRDYCAQWAKLDDCEDNN